MESEIGNSFKSVHFHNANKVSFDEMSSGGRMSIMRLGRTTTMTRQVRITPKSDKNVNHVNSWTGDPPAAARGDKMTCARPKVECLLWPAERMCPP